MAKRSPITILDQRQLLDRLEFGSNGDNPEQGEAISGPAAPTGIRSSPVKMA
jgi:hypothetical protein